MGFSGKTGSCHNEDFLLQFSYQCPGGAGYGRCCLDFRQANFQTGIIS